MGKKSKSAFQSIKMSEDLATLILNNHRRTNLFPRTKLDKAAVIQFSRFCIEMAMRKGLCQPLYEGRKLKAIMILAEVQIAPGLPMYWGFIQSDLSKESRKWLIQTLLENRNFFTRDTMIDIPVYLKSLISPLCKNGFFVDTVQTVGTPNIARKNLTKYIESRPRPEQFGLKVQKGGTVQELRQVQKIEHAEFKRNPQYGWFVSSEAWLAKTFATRKKNLKRKDAAIYLLKKGAQVLGYFSADHVSSNFKGCHYGIDFIFDRSIQGKGLSYYCYYLLMDFLIEQNASCFTGNTSQGPTLKLSKIMRRLPVSYCLRYGKGHFAPDHFNYSK